MNNRLFIALPIPEGIREKISSGISLPDNFRLTRRENLHITILFLGETEASKNGIIINQLSHIIKNHRPFDLEISRYGQFPKNGYPRIIYFTGIIGLDRLCRLAEDVRNNFSTIGFTDDKSFEYHITVARQAYKKDNEIILPEMQRPYCFRADSLVLYRSELKPGGPVYSRVWSAGLAGV